MSSDFRLPLELDRDVKKILTKARALIAASEFTSERWAERLLMADDPRGCVLLGSKDVRRRR